MGKTSLITNIEGWVVREITLSDYNFPEITGDDIWIDDMCLTDDVQDVNEMYSQSLYWLDDKGVHSMLLVREENERYREDY